MTSATSINHLIFINMAKQTVILDENHLKDLPQRKSVYAIFAQSKETKKPINCRYVGETDNLQERTKRHFSDEEENECLKKFMQSEKTKMMIYELLPDSDRKDRLAKEEEWIKEFKPECNEQ
jgi:hypothetical protein